MPEHDALISQYSHLAQFEREKDALHALKKIASLVKPLMRARNWTVGTLAEFYPDQHNLLGARIGTFLLLTSTNIYRNQPEQRTEDMPPSAVPRRQEPIPAYGPGRRYHAARAIT